MKKHKRKKTADAPDAFDKAVEKKHEPEEEFPIPSEVEPPEETTGYPEMPVDPIPLPEPDVEDVSESEANAMVERAQEKKRAEQAKVESEVDDQDWSKQDPIIPEELKGKVWVAVYRCPEGHKTKATNRQAKTGVRCWDCKMGPDKKVVKASIMKQFLDKPEPPDDDAEKRKKAAKGRV